MNIKQRFSLFFSLLFSLLLASVMVVVYFLFANFRQSEFRTRLLQRAETTVRFLLTIKQINPALLEIFDKNRVNRLYNEKTTVYNDKLERIYTSNRSYQFHWTPNEFARLKRRKHVYKSDDSLEMVGILFNHNGRDYYVITSAGDTYESTNMGYLRYLLLSAFLIGTSAVWILSFYLSKKNLKPLDDVRLEIQNITDKNLKKRLSVSDTRDEISDLSRSFNQMMDRIDQAYHRQKEFTGNASHELRTPLARITAQLQNIIQSEDLPPSLKDSLRGLFNSTYQLSDIVSSLLILSEISDIKDDRGFTPLRLDELVFSVINDLSQVFPDLKTQFDIQSGVEGHLSLEIVGDERLLKIVFINLFKNAYIYSDDKLIQCMIYQTSEHICVVISNTGPTPVESDTAILFNTFVRGNNTQGKEGSGVGLSIVKRILDYHNAGVQYAIPEKRINRIIVSFPLS
jgi:two-component system, OmpR family, sensor histidine kinase ArlS